MAELDTNSCSIVWSNQFWVGAITKLQTVTPWASASICTMSNLMLNICYFVDIYAVKNFDLEYALKYLYVKKLKFFLYYLLNMTNLNKYCNILLFRVELIFAHFAQGP